MLLPFSQITNNALLLSKPIILLVSYSYGALNELAEELEITRLTNDLPPAMLDRDRPAILQICEGAPE